MKENIENLNKALSLLSSISVPITLVESITIPVYNAASIIKHVMENLENGLKNDNAEDISFDVSVSETPPSEEELKEQEDIKTEE